MFTKMSTILFLIFAIFYHCNTSDNTNETDQCKVKNKKTKNKKNFIPLS